MDIAFSVISGLFLRISVNGVQTEPLSKVVAALVGIWEGVVLHQMSSRSSSEVDHYLAYGLRVLIDYVVSNDRSKAIMILVWTTLGAFASESVTPRSALRAPRTKRERRGRSSRPRKSSSRITSSNPLLAASTSVPRLPLHPPNLQSATPQVPVTKPPSPPSFFLGAGSDLFSPTGPVHPLDLSPTRPPTGLASQLEKGEDESPVTKPVLLPTPPQSAPSDGMEYGNSRPTTSPHRLSTIHEISSGAERTPQHPEVPRPLLEKQPQVNGHDESNHTSPLPIPNLTMNGFSISNGFHNDDDDNDNDGIKHSTPFSAAVPVPNMSTSNWRPHVPDPLGVNDPLASPPWDDDALDELRTPPSHSGNGIDLGDLDDPLRTPVTMNAHMLSPLILEDELSSGVPLMSVISGPMPSISQIQALAESTAPVRSSSSKKARVNGHAAGPSLGTLLAPEPPATPASPKAQDPPSDPESGGAHSDGTSVFSTPEPTALTRKAEKLRDEARQAEKEYKELKSKYHDAVSEGKTAEAFVIKRKMFDAEEKARESHKKAAKRYYASLNELNPKQKEDTIDVHGLRPSEAIDRTERALSTAMEHGLTTLRVIVGKGLHSVGGEPVLKKVVRQAMENQKIECKVDSRNAGVLVLNVPSS